MIFSELKMIEKHTGLTFDDETAILGGNKNGVPVAVFDNTAMHRFDIFCGALLDNSIIDEVGALADSFPKKTVLGIENKDGILKIFCKGYNLMQENLPLLISFLEKLTEIAGRKKMAVTEMPTDEITKYSSIAVVAKKTPVKKQIAKKDASEKFDFKALFKGILGGIIGTLVGSSLFVVFILLSEIFGWIGGVVLSAAVISVYTFFSKKLRAVDSIICAVLILFGWGFSNIFAYLFKIFLMEQEAGSAVNLFNIISNIELYMSKYYEIANLMYNQLMVSFVFVVAGAVGSYLFYYKTHERDMY